MSAVLYPRKASIQVQDFAPGQQFAGSAQTQTASDSGTTTQFGTEGEVFDFADFKCTFQIIRGDTQQPNTCDLQIYNLSDATAKKICSKEFSNVIVQGGYESNYGLVFRGVIKQQRRGREDALNNYVSLTAADGDEIYNFATIAINVGANKDANYHLTQLIQAVKDAAVYQQITSQTTLPLLPTVKFVRGKVYVGMARDVLRKFCEAYDLTYSVQDGVLTFIPLTGYLPGEVPVISPSTGLLGVPEQTQNGIEFTSLMNPKIKVGQLIQLQSTDINQLRLGLDTQSIGNNLALQQQVKTEADGFYYVMSANHYGDTRGEDWHTDVVCLAVDSTITQNQTPVTLAIPENVIPRY